MNGSDPFFVDSNLLLYCVDPADHDKRARATDWLDQLWASGTGRLSWQVLHEFYWNAVRKMGMAAADAREMVEDLSQWRPVDTSLGLVQEAWYWMDSAQLAYWDALIVAAAQRSGALYLLSEDFQHGRILGPVTVLDPFRHSPG
jgi:predicted nucleic acid-binding protein